MQPLVGSRSLRHCRSGPFTSHTATVNGGKLWPSQTEGRLRCLIAKSTQDGAELLRQANAKYVAKDLMGAMKLYEDVLAQEDIATRQRQAALYGSTAVHAAFGDVELAQITLREAIKQGLDFEQALSDPDMVELVTSPQILIQLKRFNQQAQQAVAARSRSRMPISGSVGRGAKTKPGSNSPLSQDLGSILGSPDSDTAAIDTSVGAIIRRVLLVVLIGCGLGTALFFIGLETLFPKY